MEKKKRVFWTDFCKVEIERKRADATATKQRKNKITVSVSRTDVPFRDSREIASKISYRLKILTIIYIHFIAFRSSLRICF